MAACVPLGPTPDAMMDEKPGEDEMMPDDMMDSTATPDAMMDEEPTDGAMDESMMPVPDWYTASLTEATSGETFSIAGFKGRVVLVETMAVWCSNCLAQQRQIASLRAGLGERDDLAVLSLDIDPSEDIHYLRAFVASNGFDWLYAVAGPEVAREIGELYGSQFLNPPSTPMLIIDRNGEAHLLPFGIKNADQLTDALTPFLEEGM
jgi:hypothetical protein